MKVLRVIHLNPNTQLATSQQDFQNTLSSGLSDLAIQMSKEHALNMTQTFSVALITINFGTEVDQDPGFRREKEFAFRQTCPSHAQME